MADIFISYARADREIAKTFADAFAVSGATVWWDPDIAYGTQWDKIIEKEIGRAKCVIVLWSKRSVDSQWVRSEASEANQRGILVPIRIEADVKEPLEFRLVQMADLAGWKGDRENPTFLGLLRDIERIIRSNGRPDDERVQPLGGDPQVSTMAQKRLLLVRLALLAAPTLVALIVAGIAMGIHRPTAFNLELNLKSVSFTSAAEQSVLLLDKTAFIGLALHGIDHGHIDAKRAVLAEKGVGSSPSSSPASSTQPIPLPVRLTSRQRSGAAVIFAASAGDRSVIGELDQLFVPPNARVNLAVRPEKPLALSVQILDQPSRIVLSLRGESLVHLVEAKVDSGTPKQIDAAAVTLKLDAEESGSRVEMFGTVAGPTVLLTPSPRTTGPAILPSNIRVSALEFMAQGPMGVPVSTMSGEGNIGFAEAGDARKINVKPGEYVVLADLKNFFIRKLALQPDTGAVRLEAGGIAGSLRSGPAGDVRERTLTWFDAVWHQPRSVQLFGLAVWLFPTTLAGYKLVKELRQ